MNAATWVKLRLPEGSRFDRNGVSRTVDEAVADALDDNSGDKYLALADLLEELAADDLWQQESQGDQSRSGPLLRERAEGWRARAAAGGKVAGSFGFIPARFEAPDVRDEYSR